MTKGVPAEVTDRFEVYDWRNGVAILEAVKPEEFAEVCDVLGRFELRRSWIAAGGGSKSNVARYIDDEFGAHGWIETKFETGIVVDGVETPSPTHKVDCFKNGVALEMEWNNKDPFFDRDLNNFRLLYDLRVVDVGIIVTRTTALQETLTSVGRSSTTYGKATTHTEKLYPKIDGGGAGGCPVIVFGIKPEAFRDDS